MKICYLDFEFNGTTEKYLNLVSVAAVCTDKSAVKYERDFWLYGGAQSQAAREFFKKRIDEGYIFTAFVMEAEARSLLTLFKDTPAVLGKLKAIDLYLEYRCLLNENHDLAYGEQYINGKVIVTTPPKSKWEKEEDGEGDDELHHKPQYSLSAAIFKLLGVKIDTEEKAAVRDIIIRGDSDEILQNLDRIRKYNKSDIAYLKKLLSEMVREFLNQGVPAKAWLKYALSRGDYAIATARMLRSGYPVNLGRIEKFTANTDKILKAAIAEVLETSPEIKSFRYDKKTDRYVRNEKAVRDWVASQPFAAAWPKTDKGYISLARDAFKEFYDSTSPGFPGAFLRYLRTKQSLNGFLPAAKESKKGKFTDFVGSDGRVRPYFGIYGSKTSRSQPGSIGFMFLKAHWMRCFVEAPKGRAIIGVDYASQEFLLAAILSQDTAMMDAYASGDVYLAFAKAAGLAPKTATKDTHKKERNLCKTLVLGMSYDMGAAKMALRLSAAAGETYTEEKAQEYINLFYSTYFKYAGWKDDIVEEYCSDSCIALVDGWLMFPDNPNKKSVKNFPVQGTGAVIMREAVKLAQSQGLEVIFTLHDAVYCEIDSYDTAAITKLLTCMQQAFLKVMANFGKTIPIRLEADVWSVDYAEKMPPPMADVNFMSEYVDEKGKADIEKYRRFFE